VLTSMLGIPLATRHNAVHRVSSDRTPPVVSPDVSGMLGANNWWVSKRQRGLERLRSAPVDERRIRVASVRYQVDGGPWGEYAGAFTLSDGTHTVSWQTATGPGTRRREAPP